MSRITNLKLFALSFALVTAKSCSKPNITSTVTLSPPASPAPARQIVDGAYNSFSIEFTYMADYGGNDTCVRGEACFLI